MKRLKTKLRSRFVIGFEEGKHVVYKDGEVIFENTKLIYIGKTSDLESDITHEYGNAIISPGFIDLDACVDSDHALLDIALPRTEEHRFKMDYQKLHKTPYTKEDFQARHRYSMLHLLKNGITTIAPISGELFYEWSFSKEEAELMVESALETGVRMYIGPSFRSRRQPDDVDNPVKERQSYEAAVSFCDKWNGKHELITPMMNPCQINVTNLALLKEAAHYAQNLKIPYRIHACEAIREWNHTLAQYGKTTIELFAQEKMLYDQFMIPHGITITPNELKLLSQHKVSIINTPLADLNFATALFSFEKYAHYGINHTMGTDTMPGDMIRNMRAAWDLGRLTSRRKFFARYSDEGEMIALLPDEPDYPKLDGDAYFDAATINGAKALGRKDLGHLSVNAKADIIVVDLQNMNVGPQSDPIRTLINSCNGDHVKAVFVNGRAVVANHRLVDYDETEVLRDAQTAYNRFLNMYEIYDASENAFEDMFPSTYKII